MVMIFGVFLVACSNNNSSDGMSKKKLKIDIETDPNIELETKNDNESICCGIYTDGAYGRLIVKENGYASVTLNIDADITGPNGKYEYKSGMFYIVEDGVVTAAMKNLEGRLHLLKCKIGNETHTYEDGEKVFYLTE